MFTEAYIYDVLLLLAIVTGIVRYKKLSTPFRIITFAMIAAFLLTMLSNVLILIVKYKTNAPVLHLEAVSEFTFYSLAYYFSFTDQKIKKAIIASVVLIAVFAVFNALFLQPFRKEFPTFVNTPALALLVIFSLLLFREMLLYPSQVPILKQGVFWFNTAIIFYSTGNFLNIGLSNIISHYPSFDYVMLYFWYIMLYAFVVLITIGILTDKKETDRTYAL